jgi:hypothetical protein
MKKVLSLVLVIAMVLSSFSFAFAAPKFEDVADTDYEEAVNTLVALGVVTGYEDGTYKPERVVTRAEMAKLLVEVLGFGDLVAGSKSNFTDTQGHWADSWIALAAGRGLVIGTGDGKFTPDRTVSYDEAITMIVRGLGYTDGSNEIKNMTWPTNFKVKAAELGLTKNVNLSADGADRGGIAILLYNALEAELVTVNTDGDIVPSGKELLSRLAELDEDYKVTSEKIDPSNKNYAGDLVDLGPYIFQSLKVYLNDDDEVVYIKDTNSLVVEGVVDEVTLSTSGKVATVAVETADGSIKKVSFTVEEEEGLKAELPGSIFENRASRDEATFEYLKDTKSIDSIKIVANELEKSNNGKIEEDEVDGFVLETQTFVIRVEEEYVEDDLTLDGLVLPTNSKDEVDFTKIIVKGDADSLEDIEVDDVVVEYLAEDDAFTTLVVSRDTVEGKVTRLGGTDVYVDGVKYKRSETGGAASAPELNDEGVFYLDHNGKIVDFDAEGASATDYAIIVGAAGGELTDRFGKSIDVYPQLEVVTQEGEKVVYDLLIKLNSAGTKVTSSVKVDGNNLFDDDDLADFENDSDEKVKELFAEGKENAYKNIIKYSLNKDGKISKIEPVEAQRITEVDTTKSSFRIVDNALVYNNEDEEAVSINKLSSKITLGYAVYNKNGQIEVLVTEDTDGVKYTFAYITSVQDASRNNDDVQAIVAYVDGKKVDPLYTDADDVVDFDGKAVYALDIVNDVIEEVFVPEEEFLVTTSPSAINGNTVYKGTINDRGTDTIQIGSKWYTLSDDATVIGVKSNGDVNAVRRLSAVRAGTSVVTVYIYDGYVSFVLIHE